MDRRREESQSGETDLQASSTAACDEVSLADITKLLNELKKSVEGRLDSIEVRLSTGQTEQRAAEHRMNEALSAAMNRIKELEGTCMQMLGSGAEGDGHGGSSRWISVRVTAVNTADELAGVRSKFVKNVSKVVLSQLLDDVLEDGVLNDEEKDSILEENRTTADRARSLIDAVKRKGDLASTKMIARLRSRDPMLSTELGLLCSQPALPAAEPQRKQEWSTTLIYTTDAFWREKQNDIDIYPVTKKSFGSRVALLISNIEFNYRCGLARRNGAEIDEVNMEKLLKALGYEVMKYKDLTEQKIHEALFEFSKHPKLKETDSVLVVIMSHGELGVVYGVDGLFSIDYIYKYLGSEKCPALLNKPKIIIIQACRGDHYGSVLVSDESNPAVLCDDVGQPGPVEDDSVRRVRKEDITSLRSNTPEEGGSALVSDGPSPPAGEDNIVPDGVRKVHKEKDFISLLSSTPDTVSYRQVKQGSYFILRVVDVLNTFAHKDDIEELFRKVMRSFEDFSTWDKRQMPTKERCTLTKRFYFFPGL